MGRIGINEKKRRRREALVRVKSKELKVVDRASFLRPFCQVPRNDLNDLRQRCAYSPEAS
jgi:hypothetical protein